MKKIFLPLILCTLQIISCNKVLDITPSGRITIDDAFTDELRTEAFLNTIYLSMPAWFYSYTNLTMLAGSSDEAEDAEVGNGTPNMNASWIRGELSITNNPGINFYTTFWNGILNANIFLAHIDHATVSNEAKRGRLKAEATLLRAFYYWELTKQYGPLPIFDFAPEANFDYTTIKRPILDEVVAFIIADCDAVISSPNIPMRITLEAERGRFTKALAYALKSQVLLYFASPLWNTANSAERYRAASAASLEALTTLTANGMYKLSDNYGEYFLNRLDINNSPLDRETIFEHPTRAGANLISFMSIPSKIGMSKVGCTPTQELVDAYDMKETGEPPILGYTDDTHVAPILNPSSGYDPDNPYEGRDPRFYATIWYNGASYDNINGTVHTIETFVGGKDQLLRNPPNTNNTHTGYYLRKFIDHKLQIGNASNAGWKKFRLAEIYLNYAEAENEVSGPGGDVYSAINTVRKRAGMPDLPAGLTKDQMRQRIRKERQVEFAFEEHRFWDVRRWKILDQTDKFVTGMEITQGGGGFHYNRFVVGNRVAWQDRYLIFPIPLKDALNVPDLGNNQNPGW